MKELSPFARRLRALRHHAGMNQEQVAQALGIHRTAYTKYETDRAYPDQDRLLILADLFHVSLDYLLGRGEDITAVLELRDGETDIVLSVQELQLLLRFRGLNEKQRQEVLSVAQKLSDREMK